MSNDFGSRLRRLRKERDVTQEQLAEQIGVVPSAVGKYERVEDAFPSVPALVKIADYFGVSIDYLLCGTKLPNSVENNIGGMSNSQFTQANNGGMVYQGDNAPTPESLELLHIYESFSGRGTLTAGVSVLMTLRTSSASTSAPSTATSTMRQRT